MLDEAGGREGISLRAVARRAGVSHAAPYHHFADKDALFGAMAGLVAVQLAAVLTESGVDAKNLGDAIQRCGVAYVCFAIRNPARFRLLSEHPRPESAIDSHGANLGNPDNSTSPVLIDAIREAQEAGIMRPGDPRILALTAWSTVHGLAQLLLDGVLTQGPATEADAERLGSAAVRLLGTGFAVR